MSKGIKAKKLVCIINPKAGLKKHSRIPKLLQKKFCSPYYILDIQKTKYAGHAYEIAQNARNNCDCIIAVGGDGTIHEIAQALVNSKTALGIIPVGSGNGFARSLHISRHPHAAIKQIAEAQETRIDIISCNKEYVINIAGIGFDAEVGAAFANTELRSGYTYIPYIMKKLLKKKIYTNFTFSYNNTVHAEPIFLASIANSNQWGMNAYIAPEAHMDDGLFELVIITPFPFFKSISLAYKLFHKKIQTSKYCKTIRLSELTIHSNENFVFHVDGEPREAHTSLHFTIKHKGLRVWK